MYMRTALCLHMVACVKPKPHDICALFQCDIRTCFVFELYAHILAPRGYNVTAAVSLSLRLREIQPQWKKH